MAAPASALPRCWNGCFADRRARSCRPLLVCVFTTGWRNCSHVAVPERAVGEEWWGLIYRGAPHRITRFTLRVDR